MSLRALGSWKAVHLLISKGAPLQKCLKLLDWLTPRFELSRGGTAQNVRPMEGLRGFAVFLVFPVFLVVLMHCVTLIGLWISAHVGLAAIAGAIHAMGNAGVDLFFVLSGYLIYGSL